jgi:hypothetical protein
MADGLWSGQKGHIFIDLTPWNKGKAWDCSGIYDAEFGHFCLHWKG